MLIMPALTVLFLRLAVRQRKVKLVSSSRRRSAVSFPPASKKQTRIEIITESNIHNGKG